MGRRRVRHCAVSGMRTYSLYVVRVGHYMGKFMQHYYNELLWAIYLHYVNLNHYISQTLMNVLVVNATPKHNVLTVMAALHARAIQAGLETVRRAQVTNISLNLRFLCTICDTWKSRSLEFTAIWCFNPVQYVRIDNSELRQTQWHCENHL